VIDPFVLYFVLAQSNGRSLDLIRRRARFLCGRQTSSEADAFSCENLDMRKHIINPTEASAPTTSEEWLDLQKIARVEVTSEDPQHRIESAFKYGESLGWRASQPGEQTIRL
jgi:hypothetical protein